MKSCIAVLTRGYNNISKYDTLINNYREGIKKLISEPSKHTLYAIDKYWFKLQEKDKWFLIVPLTVTQREDYSDIEKRRTNYTNVMIDLDKKNFMKVEEIKKKPPNIFKMF